jgi:hypothetical protein
LSEPSDLPEADRLPSPVGSAIRRRLFVVGCPRSGTTLLQSFLGAHPAIHAFPETAVFARLLIERQRPDRASGEASRVGAARERATAFLESVRRPELVQLLGRPQEDSVTEFARAFVSVLDALALDRGRIAWTEKTPRHLLVVPQIRVLVPEARFLVIVRDGRQNVASLYEAAIKHPNVWWPQGRSDLDEAVNRWNTFLSHAQAIREAVHVRIVRYEKLVSETKATLEDICAFAGLPYSPEMVERRSEAAREVVTTIEPWKTGVLGPLRADDDKFERVFSAEQKAYVEARLQPIDF